MLKIKNSHAVTINDTIIFLFQIAMKRLVVLFESVQNCLSRIEPKKYSVVVYIRTKMARNIRSCMDSIAYGITY